MRNYIRRVEHCNYESDYWCVLVVVVPIRLSDSEILFELPVNTFNIVSKVVTTVLTGSGRAGVTVTQTEGSHDPAKVVFI